MFNQTDALVCATYILLVVAVGIFASRKQHKTVSGYFRAGNRLPWYAIGFSLVGAGISSEQFVGEMGYAYKIGLPVANWEWLVLPAMSILLWIFVPLYVRNNIGTMPEFLERRFGGQARTMYALLTISSYVLVNFALVFYTAGFALERMWGIDRITGVWALALVTGAYTVYGGLSAVAWTSSMQCLLLLGGGLYVFFAGMAQIDWNFTAMLGTGNQAHLFTPSDHEVPWTAMVVLMLSTNVWYYATNQYINQRCLAAKNEWHAKMGVLFSCGLQVLIPLAVMFPGMIYRVINPNLDNPDAAYPSVVAAVVPVGLRGLIVAAVLSAIMSTVSGLVNSTSTLVTLDIFQRWKGHVWSEKKLVSIGRWSGAVALLIGAGFAPIVMKWENIFRYAQDIWAPMAAPVVVVFLAAALWQKASPRAALACLWLAILSIPFTVLKSILADANIHFMAANLENPMVFAGAFALIAVTVMICFSLITQSVYRLAITAITAGVILWLAAVSPTAVALILLVGTVIVVAGLIRSRRTASPNLWDHSMVTEGVKVSWYANLWLWWLVLVAIMVSIYVWLW